MQRNSRPLMSYERNMRLVLPHICTCQDAFQETVSDGELRQIANDSSLLCYMPTSKFSEHYAGTYAEPRGIQPLVPHSSWMTDNRIPQPGNGRLA